MTEVPDAVQRVAAVCRQSATAWQAVCALLDHAQNSGLAVSPWSTDTRADAERIRSELNAVLSAAYGKDERAPYDNDLMADIVQDVKAPLGEDELAFVVARVLDDLHWPSFTHDWLEARGRTFVLGKGERFPVGEMRLMGNVGHSSRPHRLRFPRLDLPHVRRLSGEDGINVEVQGKHAAILDSLVSRAPLTLAAALINDTWDELTTPPSRIAPKNPGTQKARVRKLLRQARERDAAVVLLPELCVTASMIEELVDDWAKQVDAPMLFAGSVHMTDAGRRVNRTSVLLPGVGVAWAHDKYSVFEARDGTREPVDAKQPAIVIGCGNVVRVATVVCKDALDAETSSALGDLGVHLLAVPAMSESLGPFSPASSELIPRSQGATLVANNPRIWRSEPVELAELVEPVEHALLAHPVQSTAKVVTRGSRGAPDLGVARLGSGWEP